MKKILYTLALIVCFSSFGQESYDDYMKRGKKKLREIIANPTANDPDDEEKVIAAINDFTLAIKINPTHYSGYFHRAFAHCRSRYGLSRPWGGELAGQLDLIKSYRLAKGDDKRFVLDKIANGGVCTLWEYYNPFSNINKLDGNIREFAELCVERAREFNKLDGDYLMVEKYAEEAIYWDPSYYEAYVLNAEAKKKLRNWDELLQNAEKAIELINAIPISQENRPPTWWMDALLDYIKFALKSRAVSLYNNSKTMEACNDVERLISLGYEIPSYFEENHPERILFSECN